MFLITIMVTGLVAGNIDPNPYPVELDPNPYDEVVEVVQTLRVVELDPNPYDEVVEVVQTLRVVELDPNPYDEVVEVVQTLRVIELDPNPYPLPALPTEPIMVIDGIRSIARDGLTLDEIKITLDPKNGMTDSFIFSIREPREITAQTFPEDTNKTIRVEIFHDEDNLVSFTITSIRTKNIKVDVQDQNTETTTVIRNVREVEDNLLSLEETRKIVVSYPHPKIRKETGILLLTGPMGYRVVNDIQEEKSSWIEIMREEDGQATMVYHQ